MLESPCLSQERFPATLPSAPCPKRLTRIVQEIVNETCQEFFTPSYKCNPGIMREKESSWLISFVQTADCYDCLPPDYAAGLQGRMKISCYGGELKWGNKENIKSFPLYSRSYVLTPPKHVGSSGIASGRGDCPYFTAISSILLHAEPSDSLSSFLWDPRESLWSQVKAVSEDCPSLSGKTEWEHCPDRSWLSQSALNNTDFFRKHLPWKQDIWGALHLDPKVIITEIYL